MTTSLRRALPDSSRSFRSFNSPFLPALLAFCLAFSLCFLYARQYNFNMTAFVSAGHPTANEKQLPRGFFLQPHRGHDGQFYYRLALNPFTSTRSANGVWLDNPAYRQQRVFYPLAVWVLSLGQKNLVPWVMVAVNVLALCALGFLGGLWAKRFDIHAAWGVLLALHPGFLFSLWLNLTEILQAALLVGALWALQNRRQTLTAILISCAVLTKETALLFAVAGLGVWLWEQRENREARTVASRVWICPFVVYMAWQLTVFSIWKQLPATSGTNNLGAPLMGIFDLLTQRASPLVFVQLFALILFTFVAAHRVRKAGVPRLAKIAWLLYGTMSICLSFAVWSVDVNYIRALGEYAMCGLLIVLATSSTRMRLVFAMTMFALICYRANTVLQLF